VVLMIKDLLLITPSQTRGQSHSYKYSWSPLQVSMASHMAHFISLCLWDHWSARFSLPFL